jgi:hypothetical protein
MKTAIQKVALRNNAIYITSDVKAATNSALNETTSVFVVNCAKLGFNFSEQALQAINTISTKDKLEIFTLLKEVTGVNKNWTPLVKQWDTPTGESFLDHIVTFFSNLINTNKGTALPCGHTIPDGTFPMERYNGCPFCGTPFEFATLEYTPSTNKLKTLELWTTEDVEKNLASLLHSPVALDATQVESLKALLAEFDLPEAVEITMKETKMVVIDAFIENNAPEKANQFFTTPTDVLRFLWFKHTGFLQIIEPKVIVDRMKKNLKHFNYATDQLEYGKIKEMKLKFSRPEAKMYANWLNGIKMPVASFCENMHPKRAIWVRVIRALRLAEFAKRKGFEKLAEVLDAFYNSNYEVWQGNVNRLKLKSDEIGTFDLLKQRPGAFARSLFSSMLYFGPDTTINHFKQVIDQVPARLVFTLTMYAEMYFTKYTQRSVKPLGGVSKQIGSNPLINLYDDGELIRMQKLVSDLSIEVIKINFKKQTNVNKTMYIDPSLFNIPIAIGDRSESVQDLPSALMGTRFKVEGDTVRLFMQWGEGLPAQHLDMDLSCHVSYDGNSEFCSYSQLVIPGCKHSGDIQYIPAKIGTAEYIDVDLQRLKMHHAKFVTFTCNAYSNGSISPNVVVGWMNSKSPMHISESGVAFDPTAVQHQVRVTQTLTKGLIFGVLDVEKSEIIWLEMSYHGQIIQNMNFSGVETFLRKLDAKLKIGTILKLKAEVQGLEIVNQAEQADEKYTPQWGVNTAEVSKLLLV